MPKDTIKQSIIELKSHLDQPDSQRNVDTRELEALSVRLETMMQSEHWETDLVEELEKQVILYEENHPVVARVVNQIIQALNNMGL